MACGRGLCVQGVCSYSPVLRPVGNTRIDVDRSSSYLQLLEQHAATVQTLRQRQEMDRHRQLQALEGQLAERKQKKVARERERERE